MKRPSLLVALALLLGACAPAVTTATGRIVNVRTGQEGTLQFSGPLASDWASPNDNTAVVTLNGDVYSGRYTVLESVTISRPARSWLGFGFSAFDPRSDSFFGSADLGAVRTRTPENGNLIARSASGKVLTCEFQTDASHRGIGTCQDAAGAQYALQF